ncbi:MAG: hypothetical protein HN712_15460 [Gemmatimonadetes bacterium]|jgi:hypothetical protein|nr:hypothetical protein [Gemmatimonadota bacterium]
MNSPDTLHPLLSSLPVDCSGRSNVEGWDVEPISGGANNCLYRARRAGDDVAVKFTVRDERDRAEDLAEMMTHVTYMDVAVSRWRWVLDRYLEMGMEVARERVQICLAIKIVGWVVRIARSLGRDTARSEWRRDARRKYEYYLERLETDDLVCL